MGKRSLHIVGYISLVGVALATEGPVYMFQPDAEETAHVLGASALKARHVPSSACGSIPAEVAEE